MPRNLRIAALLIAIGCLVQLRSLAEDAIRSTAQPKRQFIIVLPDASKLAATPAARLFVFLSSREVGEPRRSLSWFKPDPFFALNATDLAAGRQIAIDDRADAFPAALSQLAHGKYRAQAVLDRSLDSHNPGTAPGNWYSDPVELSVEAGEDFNCELSLVHEIEDKPFAGNDWVREIRLPSKLLSAFHGREVIEPAAVVLPKSYFEEPERRYPVIYGIPGFGGNYRDAQRYKTGGPAPREGETEFLLVYLSGECRWGHHVYANSRTNGPRGDAFIEEMIPYLDQHYRTVPSPTARFVMGHSSGGWASLWLMVNYPEHLGGAWCTSPDPVDFRNFQQIDLYAQSANMYLDAQGQRRPIARANDKPVLWYDSFAKMDDVLYRGGQLRSFEAVFSPRGADGQPVRLWDRQTGAIDPAVAKEWERYDIRLLLERNWNRLEPLLAGKLHIWTGSLDTFYLEGAVKLLKQSLAQLGSDAEITIVPDRNHATILTPELNSTIRRQMSETFLAAHPAK